MRLSDHLLGDRDDRLLDAALPRERRDRWRLGAGERIEAPAAAADFPAEIVRPPREWAERIFSDLRRWTEMPRGGHFAAFEEPELLADDVIEFLAGL